jgi:hypothetical protein
LRRLHLIVGTTAFLAFLITGQFMRHHSPPMLLLSDSVRLMFRSRHIYILAAALVNLMLGLYMQRHSQGWRRVVQAIGSAFVIASPMLLILAFTIEPQRGFQEEMHASAAGLYTLFLGAVAYVISGPVKS